MKRVILLALFVAGAGCVSAQKVGHVNALEVITKMPEKAAADKQIDQLTQTYTSDIEGKTKALQTRYEELQGKAKGATPQQLEQWEKELQEERQKIDELRKQAYAKIEEKRGILYEPLLKKVQDAIDDVAVAEGINYVIDASPDKGVLVFEKGGNDLTPSVKTKLGIK